MSVMERPRIIIVGAGLSGIAAAQTLFKKGFTNVQILEANDRVGGRIHTQQHGLSHIEFGAQWIHGQGSNPIYQMALQHGLLQSERSTDDEDEEDEGLFYTQRGHRIPNDIVKEVSNVLYEILDYANKFSREDVALACGDDSVGTYARQAFVDYLRTQNDTVHVADLKQAIFDWKMLAEKTENGCKSADELSLYSWGQYLEYEGHEAVVLKYGYDPILQLLLADIPQQLIHLRAEVKTIQWTNCDINSATNNPDNDDQQPVSITLVNGDKLKADYVIFTGSLGVLKAHARSMFHPPLPGDKLTVIERMGFGTVNKIYLEYDQPFWDKDCDSIQLAWSTEPFHLNCLDNEQMEEYGEWYRGIHGFDVVDHHTNLLCGWIAGHEATVMETIDDRVIENVCQELLHRFMGSRDVPRPTHMIRTKWSSDEFTRGSYSYIMSGNTAADCDILANPLPSTQHPHLLFAGEATSLTYFSTTHGALLSGQREAERIIECCSKANQEVSL